VATLKWVRGGDYSMIDQETLIRTLVAERVKMLGYIQSIIRRHDLAEDIFQDVCAASVQKREMIESEDHLRNWMRMAARRQAMNIIRKRQESCVLLDHDVIDLLEPVWKKHDTVDSSGRAEALRGCLQHLSKAHQDLVRKRFVQEYDYDRLAKEINRTVGSMYVTFSRIYATLGKCISSRLNAGVGSEIG
jgi:RNA polymerase sigma-70 factor, ECF subfamily